MEYGVEYGVEHGVEHGVKYGVEHLQVLKVVRGGKRHQHCKKSRGDLVWLLLKRSV